MIVSEILDTIKAGNDYVVNSLINKSFDDLGATYKWLERMREKAARREIFISTTGTGTLEGRTVIEFLELDEAL